MNQMAATNRNTPEEYLKFIGFNQDAKSISVGHNKGVMFYKTADALENTRPTPERLDETALTNFIIVERLLSSSLFVAVSEKDPRTLLVYNVNTKTAITNIRFPKSILAVRLHRERVVVCQEDAIYIYSLKDMKLIHSIMDTPFNKHGVMDLTSNPEDPTIAYPGSADTGSIHLFDAINVASINTFVAHEGPLACLKFNHDGRMLATASMKGTVIRVYSVPSGERLFEFRRGVSRCVTINSLCFSADSKFLASSSNTETVHVFKLDPELLTKKEPEEVGWFESINRTISSFLPSQVIQVSELVTTERSFATAKLPGAARSNQVALVSQNEIQYVMAATSEGFVYSFRMDLDGGELDLVKQNSIGPGRVKVPVLCEINDMNSLEGPPKTHTVC